jgi:hypothetical protein
VTHSHTELEETAELRLPPEALAPEGWKRLHKDELWIPRPSLPERLELRLGSPNAAPCYVVPGDAYRLLDAEFMIIQPEVVRKEFWRGWLPIGGRYSDDVCLGRDETPELDLDARASREHLYVSVSEDVLALVDTSRNGTWLSPPPESTM